MLNSAFNEEKAVEQTAPETPLWKQPETIALAKDGLKYALIVGIGLFLLLGVIRPAFKTLMTPPAEPARRGRSQIDEDEAAVVERRPSHPYENNLQAAKQMAQRDPKIVASVVKEWVNKDE